MLNCWGNIVFILLKRAVENGRELWYGIAGIAVQCITERYGTWGNIVTWNCWDSCVVHYRALWNMGEYCDMG